MPKLFECLDHAFVPNATIRANWDKVTSHHTMKLPFTRTFVLREVAARNAHTDLGIVPGHQKADVAEAVIDARRKILGKSRFWKDVMAVLGIRVTSNVLTQWDRLARLQGIAVFVQPAGKRSYVLALNARRIPIPECQ